MIVKDLKEFLETVDDNLPIVLQSNPEGNDYWQLGGGEIDEPREDYSREDYPSPLQNATVLVLYPGY